MLPEFDPYTQLRLQVKGWLQETGWTQRELAKELGWGSEGFLSDFLSGKTGLSVLNFYKLASFVSSPRMNLNRVFSFLNTWSEFLIVAVVPALLATPSVGLGDTLINALTRAVEVQRLAKS